MYVDSTNPFLIEKFRCRKRFVILILMFAIKNIVSIQALGGFIEPCSICGADERRADRKLTWRTRVRNLGPEHKRAGEKRDPRLRPRMTTGYPVTRSLWSSPSAIGLALHLQITSANMSFRTLEDELGSVRIAGLDNSRDVQTITKKRSVAPDFCKSRFVFTREAK